MIFKQAFAVVMGEGRNIIIANPGQGHQFTGRLELLPLGEFTGKGDFFGADLEREPSPKISFGIVGDINNDAVRQRGNLGSFNVDSLGIYTANDISTLFADMMFKYNGVSIMSEYAHRTSAKNANNIFGTGNGFVFQIGYLLLSNWELAARYTDINAANNSSISELTEYTAAISKYIVGHNLKVQSDISFADIPFGDNELIYRLQVEVAF